MANDTYWRYLQSLLQRILNLKIYNKMDLFETPELIPKEVKAIFERHAVNGEWDYLTLSTALEDVQSIGYTFEYYLEAEPFNLKPIKNFKHEN